MKRIVIVSFAVLMFLAISATDCFSQKKINVKFAKGATSATLNGKIAGYAYIDYVVGASENQSMTVNLTAANRFLSFVIFDKYMESIEHSLGETDWAGELPASGNYTIRVLFPRAEARRKSAKTNFTLKISIE